MPDAALSFAIDSSQAQRAISVLEALKATSIQVTQASQQLSASNVSLTQSYGQQRDILSQLATQTNAYGGTLGGLADRLSLLRTGVTGTTAAWNAYTDALRQANAVTTQFNANVEGLDRYVSKARELRIQVQDLATGFANITAALRNQTVEGLQARTTLDQLGVSLAGVATNNPAAVLQRIGDQLRQFRTTAETVRTLQQVLGPGFDANAAIALRDQPYVPYRQQQAAAIAAEQQGRIDAAAIQNQRIQAETARFDAQLADNRRRYSQDPTLLGRLGLNFNPLRALTQTRAEEEANYARIAALPEDQRRAYTGIGAQIGDFFTTGGAGRTLRAFGNYPSNLAAIATQFGRNINQQGYLPAIGTAIGQLGGITPGFGNQDYRITENDQALLPRERYEQRFQAGQILGQFGDQSLLNQAQTAERLRQFTAGGDQQRRYVEQFKFQEGTRRYALQLGALQTADIYARRPEEEANDEIRRQQYLLSVPPEQRQAAQARLGYLASQNIPFAQSGLASSGQETAARGLFAQGVTGVAQQRTEDTRAQIEFQKQLASTLTDGRAAAEDYTRAWQAFHQAQLESAGDARANQQAFEALSLAITQRITQGTALVTQMEREGTAAQRILDQTKSTINADPGTRAAAQIIFGIEADRQKLIDEGQLPNPQGGRWFNRTTGQWETVAAPQAQGILDRYTTQRYGAVRREGEQGLGAISSGASDQLRDARELANIVRDQNVSLERASQILATQNQIRDTAAKAALSTTRATLEELDANQRDLEVLKQKTEEDQRQATIAENLARNLDAARQTGLNTEVERWIQSQPAYLQEALRRGAAARVATINVTGGNPGLSGAPIAATDLPPEAQGLLRGIYGGEQGPAGYQTPANAIGATGRGQQMPKTHLRAAGYIGADPSDWSPETQDRENWALAQADYRHNTGRDLLTDLRAARGGDQEAAKHVATGLNTTWSSLPGGAQPNQATSGFFARAGLTGGPGGGGGGIPERTDADIRQVRQEREGEQERADRAAAAQRDLEARRATLIARGDKSGAARLSVFNPEIDPDFARREQQRAADAAASQQRLEQTGIGAQTNIEIEAAKRRIAALHESDAALKEVDRQLQIDQEIREHGIDNVDRQSRSIQLQTKDLDDQREALAAQSRTVADSIEQQKAVNALGFLATPGQQEAAREQTQLQQQLNKTPGLAGTSEAAQAEQDIRARQALAQQTEEINQMKQAAQGTSRAVETMLDAIIVHGEKARAAVKTLGQSLEEIAIRAFVIQPLERAANQLFSGLFGGDASSGPATGAGGPTNTTGGLAATAGGGLLGTVLARAGNALFGGGATGSQGAVGPAGTPGASGGLADVAATGGTSSDQPNWTAGGDASSGPATGAGGPTNTTGGLAATAGGGLLGTVLARAGNALFGGGATGSQGAVSPAGTPGASGGLADAAATGGISSDQPNWTAGGDGSGPVSPGRVYVPPNSLGAAEQQAIAGAGKLALQGAGSAATKALGGSGGGSGTDASGGLIGAIVNKIGGPGFYQGGGLIGQAWQGSSLQNWWQNSSIGQYFGASPGGGAAGQLGSAGGPGADVAQGLGQGANFSFGTSAVDSAAGPGADVAQGLGQGANFSFGTSAVDSAAAAIPDIAAIPTAATSVDALSGLDVIGDFFARGAIFPTLRAANSNSLAAYENQIVDRPTIFRFAKGVGMMGEAGPEAVVPLQRGPDGRLGISGAGAGNHTVLNMNISTPDTNSFHNSRSQLEARGMAAMSRAAQRNFF